MPLEGLRRCFGASDIIAITRSSLLLLLFVLWFFYENISWISFFPLSVGLAICSEFLDNCLYLMWRGKAEGHVVVTGAGKGIGADCCLHLAEQGYVVWAGVRDMAAGEEMVKTIPLEC